MKLLIGFDGSDCAKAAVEDLVLAGLPGDVDALVLSVADMPVRVPYEDYRRIGNESARPACKLVRTARGLAAEAMCAAEQSAVEGVAMVATLFPGWNASSEVVADSPYRALVTKAEEWRADLVVIGAQGRFVFNHLLLGSVSQNVLCHAGCSVRVGRTREHATAGPPRVIVGVDASTDSEAAVDRVLSRSWPDETQVRVVTAVDPHLTLAMAYELTYFPSPADEPDVLVAARQHADRVAQRLRDAAFATTVHVAWGDPKKVLVDEARSWRADAIVVGARGHSRLERFLIGSVSAAVAARASCTVEVVRTAPRLSPDSGCTQVQGAVR